jgi:hypothetical protein
LSKGLRDPWEIAVSQTRNFVINSLPLQKILLKDLIFHVLMVNSKNNNIFKNVGEDDRFLPEDAGFLSEAVGLRNATE